MFGNSRAVDNGQLRADVAEAVKLYHRHQQSAFRRPIHARSRQLFAQVRSRVERCGRPIRLDSGCGTGTSTFKLAASYPDSCVIGIDKSADRLRQHLPESGWLAQDNLILARFDIVDFWRLALAANWQLQSHHLLYPNPWPKTKQRLRRWYCHAVFPTVLQLKGMLELRTNWAIYAQEMQGLLAQLGYTTEATTLKICADSISPFEWKYHASGHRLHRLVVDLDKKVVISNQNSGC